MFDVGFSELMVIAVVALIFIGPERLPRVARTLGHLFGRLQRYVNDVKADINRESELTKTEGELNSLAQIEDPAAAPPAAAAPPTSVAPESSPPSGGAAGEPQGGAPSQKTPA